MVVNPIISPDCMVDTHVISMIKYIIGTMIYFSSKCPVPVRCILYTGSVSVRCIIFTDTVSLRCTIFTDTVSVRCILFTVTVSVRCILFTDTVSVRCTLFTDTVSVNNLFQIGKVVFPASYDISCIEVRVSLGK